MGMKDEAEKAKGQKSQQSAGGGSKMTAEQRAAMLRGTSEGKGQEVGLRALYKPSMFEKNGKGFLEDAEGHPTAPEVHGIAIDVITNDKNKAGYGDFEQILILLLDDTFIVPEATKEPEVCKAGTTLLITRTDALDIVAQNARDPEYATEFWLRPKREKPLGGKQTIWEWSIKMGTKKQRNTEIQVAEKALPNGKAPEQMSA